MLTASGWGGKLPSNEERSEASSPTAANVASSDFTSSRKALMLVWKRPLLQNVGRSTIRDGPALSRRQPVRRFSAIDPSVNKQGCIPLTEMCEHVARRGVLVPQQPEQVLLVPP